MADETTAEGSQRHHVSRRSLIKAGAVVGGSVWIAPVVDSFVSKAAAASGPTPNFTTSLCGIDSISWVAVVIYDGTHYYLAKIDAGKTTIEWYDPSTQKPSFPCGGSSTWTPPGYTYTYPGPSNVTVTLSGAAEVTLSLSSGEQIISEEGHGGAYPNGSGSTCGFSSMSFTGPGSVSFVPGNDLCPS